MEQNGIPPTNAQADMLFDLGTWLGRHQAFGLIAGKCSAADAHALAAIRQKKLYRALNLPWEEFCHSYAGCSGKTADQIISRLEEFGEVYFTLSQIVSITVPEHRALAPAIRDDVIELHGERIPIARENAERIAGIVRELRGQLRDLKVPFAAVQKRMDRCFGEIAGAVRRGVNGEAKRLLLGLLDEATDRIEGIRARI